MADTIREQIIGEAMQQINDHGTEFHMDDLAKNLRISKRTLYEHFSSKQEIIEETLRSLMDDVYQQHQQLIADPTLTTEEKIIRFGRVRTRNITVLSVRKVNEVFHKVPGLCQKLEELHDKDFSLLSQLLDTAMEEEDFKPFDKFLILHMLRSAADDIVEYFDDVERDYSFSEYMEKCIRVILYGIKKDRGQSTNDTKE
ncbi:TetR/AcrR family transcriptional regulator [uncultured Megasphaera sp.]|uniref:TetR/AcrR family transcriptional regulator n=1 Tax=uncultured Megasphaera sp. TaxID=165188 RepID=UPI002657CD89|nr:TetR/AcrR family transcriptional regulator [uncultured Megasphaera sp.]